MKPWVVLLALFSAIAQGQEQRLDDFDDLSPWRASASDDVQARLRSVAGTQGKALCLDFDFGQVSGYAVARRALPLDLPEGNYEIVFDLRGDAPRNTLQFKLTDAGGENVWWVHRPDTDFPHQWQTVHYKKRHLAFAWGPTTDRRLRHTEMLELVIASGQGGGKGSVCFDRLRLRTVPAAGPTALRATATTTARGSAAAFPLADGNDGNGQGWRSEGAKPQSFTLDMGARREFSGLTIDWLAGRHARRYAIDISGDGTHWTTVRRVRAGVGGRAHHWLKEAEARYVRLRLQEAAGGDFGIGRLQVRDLAWAPDANGFFTALAAEAPRGAYPRAYRGEQSYWTVVGIDGGHAQALLGEDGALEPGIGLGAVEPFLVTEGRWISWADATISHGLPPGGLPLPHVHWQAQGLSLTVTAFGQGDRSAHQVVARYQVRNDSDQPRQVDLVLAARPFQVNPPSQFLNTPGGVSPIRQLRWTGSALEINGRAALHPLPAPARVAVAPFESSNLEALYRGGQHQARDETGFAAGIMVFPLMLPARGEKEVALVAPLHGPWSADAAKASTAGWAAARQAAVAAAWQRPLGPLVLQLPPEGRLLADTLNTAHAHILINRDGPALQPGSRSYRRSWIRDGAMTSASLLRLGDTSTAREFVEWFAPHQFANGKVPCCVDRRGADPVAENDSHGQLIYAIGETYRYTGAKDWLQGQWPRVAAAIAYMDQLRAGESGEKNASADRAAYRGLLPPSISHEGYSDKPAYAYWDDFWGLTGYKTAAWLAEALGRTDEARAIAVQRDGFAQAIHASLSASMKQHHIDTLPGAADRGDFDPTSTTIALVPGDEQRRLPAAALQATYDRYWREFVTRRNGERPWEEYTPYELRNVGALVRLGERQQAWQALEFFFRDQRPAGWNQWAEVVDRQYRHVRYLGDMPHGWVASDFIRAALDLFAYERDNTLVLAAGVPLPWMLGEGIAVKNLTTPYGPLSYTLRPERRGGTDMLVLSVSGIAMPPGGAVMPLPWPGHGAEMRLGEIPGEILLPLPENLKR